MTSPAYSPNERRAHGLLMVMAWAGAGLQLVLSIRLALARGLTPWSGLVSYLGYFTILTNLFVALASTAWVWDWQSAVGRGLRSARARGCATTAIVLVGVGYHGLLRRIWSPQGWQAAADGILHYAVPAGALVLWCVFPPKVRLPWRAVLAWCAYPVGYFFYLLLRGAWLGMYPYPFVNVTKLGYPRVIANGLGLLAIFAMTGILLLAWERRYASAQD